jgi:hypothetical protein
VPEHIVDGHIVNLHQMNIQEQFKFEDIENETNFWVETKMVRFFNKDNPPNHKEMIDLATEFYENGNSCIDLIKWVKKSEKISAAQQSHIVIGFDEIKSEYRCEKLLLLYMFDFILEILEQRTTVIAADPPKKKIILRKKIANV